MEKGGVIFVVLIPLYVGTELLIALLAISAWTAIAVLVVACVIIGFTVMGLITLGCFAREAIKDRNQVWLFDLVTAPLLASVFTVLLFGPFEVMAQLEESYGSWLESLSHYSNPVLGNVLALIFGIIGFVTVMAAFWGSPVMAIAGIGEGEDRSLRIIGGYIGFLLVGLMWGEGIYQLFS